MNTINTILLLSRSQATLVILSLLLVSVIIGYVTAWLYFRNKHRKDTKTLNSILNRQKHQTVVLNEDISKLQKMMTERNNEIERSAKELENLKSITTHTSQDKTNLKEDNLRMISGIGPFIEERLHAIDIHTYEQISKLSQKDIETMNTAIEFFAGRIERDEWVAQARELLLEETHEEILNRIRVRKTQIYFDRIGMASLLDADNLTLISGIGGWIEQKLNALDIFMFEQISKLSQGDIKTITEILEISPDRIKKDDWVGQAKELLKNKASISNN